jgi:hypothetical protein
MTFPRIVTAYHGCSADVGARILAGEAFKPSTNNYDWLGRGVYFWEEGSDRAWRWAAENRAEAPAVIGARIDLEGCFDLLDTRYTQELRDAVDTFETMFRVTGLPLPRNKGKRHLLDCDLINTAMKLFASVGLHYRSVRCAFQGGEPVFSDGAGNDSAILMETHIQMAVRDPLCIVELFPVDAPAAYLRGDLPEVT